MPTVKVDLDKFIIHGSDGLLVRIRVQDKRDIARAAKALKMSQAQFVRTVVVQAARIVVAESEAA
jgi:uncharacterized protein (DUF1778 family)